MSPIVSAWWSANQNKFDGQGRSVIMQKITDMPDDKFMRVSSVELKDPNTFLLVTIFLGGFGVHRFMLGEYGMGILELLTGGLCGILWLIDVFTILGKVRKMNYNAVLSSF